VVTPLGALAHDVRASRPERRAQLGGGHAERLRGRTEPLTAIVSRWRHGVHGGTGPEAPACAHARSDVGERSPDLRRVKVQRLGHRARHARPPGGVVGLTALLQLLEGRGELGLRHPKLLRERREQPVLATPLHATVSADGLKRGSQLDL